MKITFISNYFNHHQSCLSEIFSKKNNIEYYFIATEKISQERLDNNWKDMNNSAQYIIRAYDSDEALSYAIDLVYDSDVVLIGSAPDLYIKKRLKANKLTFRYSERLFKHKPWYLMGPRGWIIFYKHHFKYRKNKLYMLAASAYTACDVHRFGAYKNKVYKWGYFTKVDMKFRLESPDVGASSTEIIPLMWCARFLSWKHPELPVKLARCLKDKGYKFILNMYGSGVELEKTQKLAKKLNVCDVVNFCGVLPNEQILEQMKKHEIFLFTSDFNEGWGAVLNESMSCGCVPVASHAIGAVPFLIQNNINGLIFESENLISLAEKVEYLLSHPNERLVMRQNSIRTMQNKWNPEMAASRFLQIADAILAGEDYPNIFSDGICSLAEDYKNNWYQNNNNNS